MFGPGRRSENRTPGFSLRVRALKRQVYGDNCQLLGLRRWCKRRIGALAPFHRNPLDDAVCLLALRRQRRSRRTLAVEPAWPLTKRCRRSHRLQGSTFRDRPRPRCGPDWRARGGGCSGPKLDGACWLRPTISASRRSRQASGASRCRFDCFDWPADHLGGFLPPLGSPKLGDFPLAERMRQPGTNQSLDNLVTQVEAHLEKNPTDGRGWNVLAPVLTRLGRYDDAVRAYRNSITYNGESAERRADLGEALHGCGRWRRHRRRQDRIRTCGCARCQSR